MPLDPILPLHAGEPVPTEQSKVTLARVMGVMDANNYGDVHGGVIMRAVDEAGAVAAVRHSGGPAVTAFMDQMAFLEPVKLGDLLTTKAQVNWTGRTSMEVGVRVSVQRMGADAEIHVATAHLVFVAIDADGKPRPVPPVLPETEHDRLRFQEAEIRRTSRLERREAIKRLREQGLEH
ncbi:MAG: acyl-CoA thioesterase [Candidatus Nanopelagicales bacterium]